MKDVIEEQIVRSRPFPKSITSTLIMKATQRNHKIQHSVQSLMSRTGSFPLSVAHKLLDHYAEHDSIILDPFCGKGTSLLAARMLGLRGYGSDVAPEAVVCSRAKMANVHPAGLESYIKSLPIRQNIQIDVPSWIDIFFNHQTLKQIISVRDIIMRDIAQNDPNTNENARFSLGMLLGILHGHASYSLSVASAHAYSMAPNYVKRYSKQNGIEPPVRDVKSCLLNKLKNCLKEPLPPRVSHKIEMGDFRDLEKLFPALINEVDIIITSPPYLNAQTYAKDNWLRLWLLGYDYKNISSKYLQTGSVDLYSTAMKGGFTVFHRMLKTNGLLICIAGDVRRKRMNSDGIVESVFETGEFLAEICKTKIGRFEICNIEKQNVVNTSRYYHSLNKSNGHTTRNLTETVFVAKKVE